MKDKTVSVIIVTWNSAGEIQQCLQPLKDLPDNWEVWVVDNKSLDETVEIVKKEFGWVKLIVNRENLGFAKANNQVINQTNTDYVLLLNPDTEAFTGDLKKSLKIIEENPETGMLGVKLTNEDGSLQSNCFHFPTPFKNFIDSVGLYRIFSREKQIEMFAGDLFDYQKARRVDWLMGAFMLVRREAIKKAGAVPEDYFLFGEDIDWCWQITKSGFEIRFSPEASVKHKVNKSGGQMPSVWRTEKTLMSKYLFCLKNFGWATGKFIQVSDLIGASINMSRLSLKKSKPNLYEELKTYRRITWKSLWMSEKKIRQKLHQK